MMYCSLCCNTLYGTVIISDSLRNALCTSKNDTHKIKIYTAIATQETKSTIALRYADSAIYLANTVVAKKTNYTTRALALLGDAYFNKAKLLSLTNHSLKIQCLNKALSVFQQQNNLVQISNVYNSKGVMYEDMLLDSMALYYFNKVKQIEGLILKNNTGTNTDSTRMMRANMNIGIILVSINKETKALAYLLPAHHYFKRTHNNYFALKVGRVIAGAYMFANNTTMAWKYLTECKQYIDANTPTTELLSYNLRCAQLCQIEEKYSLALRYLTTADAIRIKNKMDVQDYYGLNLQYAEVYEKLNDHKNAMRYYKLMWNQTDSMYALKNNDAAIEYETKYATVAKENEILKLANIAKINQLKLAQETKRKTQLAWFALIAVVVISALCTLAYWLRNTIQKLNVLNTQIVNNTHTLTQQASAISRYQSQMNPHFIFNAINSIQGLLLNNETQLANTQLDAFSVLMRNTLNNSEHEYIPLTNELKFLNDYVLFEQHNSTFKFLFTIHIDPTIDADNVLIPPMLLQPFIENSIKHGGFNTIANAHIQLTVTLLNNHILHLSVIDNGRGIVPNNTTINKQSRAINIAKERLRLCCLTNNVACNNCFELVNNTANTGVTVNIQLPYLENF
ncbi:MAG: histidine kinase [Bacteroidia bacterium]